MPEAHEELKSYTATTHPPRVQYSILILNALPGLKPMSGPFKSTNNGESNCFPHQTPHLIIHSENRLNMVQLKD